MPSWMPSGWEIVGAVTGLLGVYLAIKDNVWNWLWGIVSSLVYAWVFYQDKLYSSAALQIVCFVPLSIYGWWVWLKGRRQTGAQTVEELPVTRASGRELVILLVIAAVFSALWGRFMEGLDAAAPYVDAAMLGLSIVGQYLQARKQWECWHVWIAVNAVYGLYLYPTQKLYATTVLYIVFLVMAVLGLREWQRIMRVEGEQRHQRELAEAEEGKKGR